MSLASSHEDIISELKNKIYKPLYLLSGEESYFIDKVVDYIEDNVLTEDEKSFNLTVIYGKDADVRQIDSIAKRYPMMSNYQVVIIKEAQDLKGINDLVFYAEKPLKSTILVVSYKHKEIDARGKLYKTFEKNGTVLKSKRLYENQVPNWIVSCLKTKGMNIKPEAATMISDFLGTDLSKVENELNKLQILLPPGTTITPDHVEKNIGISKDYNVFELMNAIGSRNILKANKIINYFGENTKENPPVLIIDRMYVFFTQLLKIHALGPQADRKAIATELGINEFFAKDYITGKNNFPIMKIINNISTLREFDLKSKGLGGEMTPGQLLKELTFKILH